MPFKFMGYPEMEIAMKEKSDDAYRYFKTNFPSYDVALANLMHRPEVILLNRGLIEKFGSLEGDFCYQKMEIFNKLMETIIGKGVVFLEGN